MDQTTQQGILAGDLDAYGDVVHEHQGMLLGYALRRLGDWTLAEEVVQLTFIRAHQKLDEFDPDKDFGVRLCATCKFLILNELEKRHREMRNKSNYRDALEIEIASAAVEADESDSQHDQLASLRACVSKLKGETAALVELRYFKKMSCKEIAEEKSRTVTWVTSTLSRVRKSLRKCLETQPEGEALS